MGTTLLWVGRLATVAGLTGTLTACSFLGMDFGMPRPGSTWTPSVVTKSPVVATSVPATASPGPASASPTSTATPTPTSSGTKTPTPPVRATGQLTLFKNLVSKAFVGTCQRVDAQSVFRLADKKNPFFQAVNFTVVVDAGRRSAVSVAAEFGEDSDGIVRTLSYQASDQAKGTSATLTTSGKVVTVTGKALIFEDRSVAGEIIPFTIKVTCATATL